MTALYQIGDFVEFVPQPMHDKPEPKCHYMLRLHPNYERQAEQRLRKHDIDAYVPKEGQNVRTACGRYRWRSVPIFSGILFIPDYDANVVRLREIATGVAGLVKVAGEALKITPHWMIKIRQFELKMQEDAPHRRKVQIGEQVRIVGGPWDLWEGKVIRLDPRHRIKVLINAVIGEVPVELDESQVEAV